MRTRSRFGLRQLVAVLGLTVAMLPPVLLANAPAAHAAVCPPGSGVSVIVDFGQLGSVNSGCAAGSPSTGLKALSGAGFGYKLVSDQPGMVCRINNLPNPCVEPPPVDKYWSYWIAERGGSWTYSTKGAGNRTPPVGSVDGWAFGAGKPPAQAPPAKGSTGGGGDSDGGGNGGSDSGGDSAGGSDDGKKKSGDKDDPSASKDDKDGTDSPSGGESDAADGTGSGEDYSQAAGAGASDGGVGSSMGTVGGVFGGAVVAVLLAALGWRIWQRRNGTEAPPEPAE